jgi:hypothetical protein
MTTVGVLAPGAFQKPKSLGQIAYEAYFENSGGLSLVSCQPLPTWNEQRQQIRDAWEAAAAAVKSKT